MDESKIIFIFFVFNSIEQSQKSQTFASSDTCSTIDAKKKTKSDSNYLISADYTETESQFIIPHTDTQCNEEIIASNIVTTSDISSIKNSAPYDDSEDSSTCNSDSSNIELLPVKTESLDEKDINRIDHADSKFLNASIIDEITHSSSKNGYYDDDGILMNPTHNLITILNEDNAAKCSKAVHKENNITNANSALSPSSRTKMKSPQMSNNTKVDDINDKTQTHPVIQEYLLNRSHTQPQYPCSSITANTDKIDSNPVIELIQNSKNIEQDQEMNNDDEPKTKSDNVLTNKLNTNFEEKLLKDSKEKVNDVHKEKQEDHVDQLSVADHIINSIFSSKPISKEEDDDFVFVLGDILDNHVGFKQGFSKVYSQPSIRRQKAQISTID